MTQTVSPFRMDVPRRITDSLKRRLEDYMWPTLPEVPGWDLGAQPDTLRAIVDRWAHHFDWEQAQAALNELPQFRATGSDVNLHFVHFKAAPSTPGRKPVVLLHGWPSSYLEYLEVGRSLARDGHDVVVLSLPGCGFSGPLQRFMGPRDMAAQIHRLVTGHLQYDDYVVHGSDWGSLIAGWLGFDEPGHCAGVHMTMVSPRFIGSAVSAPEEQQWLASFRERFEDDGAYFRLQTSRPVTATFALHDSPVAWLAWTLEKFAAWGDPGLGEKNSTWQSAERADFLIRNAMLYLVTHTAATSTWIYRGLAQELPPGFPAGGRVQVPVAFAATRDPIFVPPPRSLVQKRYNVVRWTEYERGGHFPALEAPDLLGKDLAEFCTAL